MCSLACLHTLSFFLQPTRRLWQGMDHERHQAFLPATTYMHDKQKNQNRYLPNGRPVWVHSKQQAARNRCPAGAQALLCSPNARRAGPRLSRAVNRNQRREEGNFIVWVFEWDRMEGRLASLGCHQAEKALSATDVYPLSRAELAGPQAEICIPIFASVVFKDIQLKVWKERQFQMSI